MFKTGGTFILDDLVFCTFFIVLFVRTNGHVATEQEGSTQLSLKSIILCWWSYSFVFFYIFLYFLYSFVFFCILLYFLYSFVFFVHIYLSGLMVMLTSSREAALNEAPTSFFIDLIIFCFDQKYASKSKVSLNISIKIQLRNLDQPSPGANYQCHHPSQH